jgi:two-component system, cell cycle sensor histidine kinase and response regulator CckA
MKTPLQPEKHECSPDREIVWAENRRLKEKLKEVQLRYEELIESLPAIVFEIKDNCITDINESSIKAFGYENKDEIIGKNPLDFIVEDEKKRGQRGILRALGGKAYRTREFGFRTKDNRIIPVHAYANPIIRNGEIVGIRGIAVDVSEIKEIQEELHNTQDELETRIREKTVDLTRINTDLQKEIEERKRIEAILEDRLQFENVLSEISSAFVNLPSDQIDAQITRCLQRLVDMLQIERATMGLLDEEGFDLAVTHSWAAPGFKPFPHFTIKNRFPWIFQRILQGRTIRFSGINDLPEEAVFEKHYMQKKGTVSGCIIPQKAGKKFKGVIFLESIKTDRSWPDDLVGRLQLIGEVIASALLRRQAEQALRISEEKYRSLVEDRPGFIARWRPDGTHIFANQNYCRHFGKTREEILDSSFTLFIHPEDRRHLEKMICRLTPDNASVAGNRRVLLPNGATGWHYWNDRAVFNEKGDLVLIESSGYDISEQHRSEKAIRNIAEEITGLVGEKFFRSLADYLMDVLEADHLFIGKITGSSPSRFTTVAAFRDRKCINNFECDLSCFPCVNILKETLLIRTEKTTGFYDNAMVCPKFSFNSVAGTIIRDIDGKTIGVIAVMNSRAAKNFEWTKNILRLFALRAGAELERDITDKALRQSEQIFRNAFDHAAIGRIIVEPSGKFIRSNQAFRGMTGYSEKELFKTFWQQITPTDYVTAHRRNVKKLLTGQIPSFHDEIELVHKNGSRIWVHFNLVLVRNAEGMPQYLIADLEDITQRKIAEKELRRSEEKYRELVENANSIILRLDTRGAIRFINEYALRFFGYRDKEILGKNIVGTIAPEIDSAGRNLSEMVQLILQYPLVYAANENESMKKNGERVWVAWTNKIIQDEQGESVEILCVGNDITEQKKLEKNISEMQKMQAIGTLAGGIAHDFNNILGIIIGNAEIMEMYDLSKKSKTLIRLKKLIDAAYRGKELVSQILTFARLGELKTHPFLLAPVIRDTVNFVTSSLPASIRVVLEIQSPKIRINGDPIQIQRLVMNLAANAVQALKDQRGELNIKLETWHCRDTDGDGRLHLDTGVYALLTVADNGCGMPESQRERIFEPYYTTKNHGEGVGLGLSVVHGIVKQHDGRIAVESSPGKGSIFSVYLPTAGKVQARRHDFSAANFKEGCERILFIDNGFSS